MKYLCILFLFWCITIHAFAQEEIKVFGKSYTHRVTKTTFPQSMGHFLKTYTIAFDDKRYNVAAQYIPDNYDTSIQLSIIIYPAGDALEGRLLKEYYRHLDAIAYVRDTLVAAHSRPIIATHNGYRTVGISGNVKMGKGAIHLTVFECGKYFLKFRISNSKDTNTALIDNIRDTVIKYFRPAEIVQQVPLKQQTIALVGTPGITDTAILAAFIAGIATKEKWLWKYTDSLERCAGFPSRYLQAYKVQIQSMMNIWMQMKRTRTARNFPYFIALEKIITSGFLNEYLVDKYGGTLIVPDKITLNMEAFDKWKKENFPEYDFEQELCWMGYRSPKK